MNRRQDSDTADRKAGHTVNTNDTPMTPELIAMTDKQAKRADLLARIDELDRLTEIVTDPVVLDAIRARKKALRAELATL